MILFEKLSSTLKTYALILIIFPFITACSTSPTDISTISSTDDLHLVSHPSKDIITKVDSLMPLAMKWYGEVENALHPKGRDLTTAEKKQAKQLGVKNPDAVRVVILDKFPEPSGHIATNSHIEGARAMGNIIMIKPHLKNNSIVLCHELVHIAQKDRMGLKNFLRQLALEKHVLGYSKSPLENEAYALQHAIL